MSPRTRRRRPPTVTRPIPGHAKQPAGEVKLDDWIGETYAPKLMVAEAEKFIAAHASRPFFLYLPFTEPHVAIHPPRESVEKFPVEWDTEVYRGGNGYLPHPRPRISPEGFTPTTRKTPCTSQCNTSF